MNPADKLNDDVVRITAARQLKIIADDFEFRGEDFLPFAADTFTHLVNLLKEVLADETRLAILETVRVIVSRMETHVSQFGDAIMTVLPQLWEAAGSEEYMMKQSVLAIAAALVMSMRSDSQKYQSFMIPLLTEAMNPESDLHLHLIEDSVDLWKAMLTQSTPPLADGLRTMVELALPLLEFDSDVARECLEITKGYILMTPETMLGDSLRRETLAALTKSLDARNRGKVELGTKSIELMIRAAETLGGPQGLTVVVQDLLQIGFLSKVMEGLHSAWAASQAVGPNKSPSKISTLVQTDYFAILARIALADPSVFITMLASFVPGNTIQAVWEWMSTEWFSNFDCMASSERQKLSCLALTRLCELPQPMQDLVLGKLQDYLSMWTSVVIEMRAGVEGNDNDVLVWEELESYEYDTPLDVREREVVAKDPVHTVHTFNFVRARLQDLVQRTGGEQQFEANWAVNVDKEVLAGFQALSNAAGTKP
jgi:hypothetical protein